MDDVTLKAFREGRGVRQVDVAAFLGLSQPRVSAIERHPFTGLTVRTAGDFVAAVGGRLIVGVELPNDVMVPLYWRPRWEIRR